MLGERLLRIAKWSEQAKSKGVNHWSQSVSISNERKRFLSIKRKSLKLRKKPKKKLLLCIVCFNFRFLQGFRILCLNCYSLFIPDSDVGQISPVSSRLLRDERNPGLGEWRNSFAHVIFNNFKGLLIAVAPPDAIKRLSLTRSKEFNLKLKLFGVVLF